ncbi:hypothetical protein MHM98_03995 [Psychrobium sp. MM17-31]|uniref:Ppx/GppA phosphatase family protein n=1 Tax=Psychrobium sp. MM17-31 TaxID=2917758 RepID=UPI001EF4B669|nr:hypothetical protein [Psychrobium sp. MM17-31]MCG7530518.1 hypothetical protein [Psychrobium sp. MM17-31]
MSDNNHFVAIDIGSNSFQMIIAKEQAGKIVIVERQKQRINLALGLDENNHLSELAIERAVACLKEFSQAFSRLPQSRVRIVATHSVRKAVNRDDFIKAAFKVLPYPIEVIDGVTEAQLIFQGIAHTQAIVERTFIVDIGGGSTEFIVGRHFEPTLTASLEIGSSHLRKLCFSDGEITNKAFKKASELVNNQLVSIAERYQKFGWKHVLGTSGSIKIVSQVIAHLYQSETITLKLLNKLKKQLIEWQRIDDIDLPMFDPEKTRLLPTAVCILQNIFKTFGVNSMDYCSSALREGVLYGLSEATFDSDIRRQTLDNMTKLYHTDVAYSRRVINQLTNFVEQLPESEALSDEEYACLTWAAQLHEIGLAINSKKRQCHSAYIIEHSEMLGFNDYEKTMIRGLVRYHRGKIKSDPLLNELDQTRFLTLLSLFRLAIICTKGRLNSAPIPLKVIVDDEHFIVGEVPPSLSGSNGLISDLHQEKLRLHNAGVTLNLRCETLHQA